MKHCERRIGREHAESFEMRDAIQTDFIVPYISIVLSSNKYDVHEPYRFSPDRKSPCWLSEEHCHNAMPPALARDDRRERFSYAICKIFVRRSNFIGTIGSKSSLVSKLSRPSIYKAERLKR